MPSLRIVDSAWAKELLQALSQDSSALRIICPLQRVLSLGGRVRGVKNLHFKLYLSGNPADRA